MFNAICSSFPQGACWSLSQQVSKINICKSHLKCLGQKSKGLRRVSFHLVLETLECADFSVMIPEQLWTFIIYIKYHN